MDRIWAPWRMEYILSDKQSGCFLCDIIASNDERAGHVVKRGKHCIVVLNRYPYNNGHAMVAPCRHVATLSDMTPAERSELMELTRQTVEALQKLMNADGFNIGVNLGEAAGAGLKDHLHQHIVPRWNGDTNFMPVVGETKVLPQSLDDVWETLREAMSDEP